MNTPDTDVLGHFAACIGLDWADGKHAVCLRAGGSTQRESDEIKHRPETIDEWARGLRARFGGKPVAIALELAKGPIVYALRKYEFLVLFPINPATLAKYREMFAPSGRRTIPPTPSSPWSSCSSIQRDSRRWIRKAHRCARSSSWWRCVDASSTIRPA